VKRCVGRLRTHEISNSGVRYQLVQCCGSKYLATQSKQELTHVLTPLPKATAINTSNDFIPRMSGCHVLVSLGLKLLDAGNLIPGSAIVARNLSFDNDYRTYLVRYAKNRELARNLESDPLGRFCDKRRLPCEAGPR
jgi:hypothetical protein